MFFSSKQPVRSLTADGVSCHARCVLASVFSHVIAAVALGTAFRPERAPVKFWLLAAICAGIPDLDVIGFRFGVGGHLLWGHRGFTHSFVFAALLSGIVVAVAFQDAQWQHLRAALWLFFFLATASHGILDAMTNGGSGVAFFAPFDNTRYFFPFRPIAVSPIGIRPFFSQRGLVVLASELIWIWLPSLLFAVFVFVGKRVFK